MPRKLIKSESAGDVPFLADAYERGIIQDREALAVLSVRESRSRKGYLITTEKCLIYLYKSSSWIEPLIETVTEFCENQHGFEILIIVEIDEENGIEVQVDEEIPRIWTLSKKIGNGVLMSVELPNSGKTKNKLTRRQRSQQQAT
jgi:hypothetical protein